MKLMLETRARILLLLTLWIADCLCDTAGFLSTLRHNYLEADPVYNNSRPQLDGRIVGGAEATIANFPWQVSLQRAGSHSCGGAIYSQDIIVTAAHCLQSVSPATLKVRVGSSFWNAGGTVVPVAAFAIHEDYDSGVMLNDVGLIRLAKPLKMGPTVQTISLATKTPPDGAPAVVTGWGTTFYGSSHLSTHLMKVNVSIVGRTACASSIYGYGSEIKLTMLCAYDTGKDACQGDSGGPLVSGGKLVGVVSWGYGCAYPNYPGVYADVADLHPWVLETIRKLKATN